MKAYNFFVKSVIIFAVLIGISITACSSKEATETIKTDPEIKGKFLFSSNRDPKMNWSVYIYKDGKIKFLEKQVGSAVWSPDGKRIACMSREGLVIMSEDGSQKEMIKTLFDSYPEILEWSNDGKKIYYSTSTGEYSIKSNALCEIDLTTKKQVEIYNTNGKYSISDIELSPDGDQLLIVQGSKITAAALYVFDTKSKQAILLRDCIGSKAGWFPDGKHIGFTTGLDEKGERLTKRFGSRYYFKMNVDKKEGSVVRNMKRFTSPRLSKDGKYLYYSRSASPGHTAKAIFVSPLEDNDTEIQITHPVQLVPSDLYSQDDSPDWYQES